MDFKDHCIEHIKENLDALFKKNNYGAMRVSLFAKFYEDILREYFRNVRGFHVFKGKPRIFWKDIQISTTTEKMNENHRKLIDELDKKKRNNEDGYCIPDGLFFKNGKYFLWEAKNWIPELFEKNPFSKYVWTFPWLLAKKVTYKGKKYPISGFIISWWDNEEGLKNALTELRQIVAPLTVEVVFTKDVLCECISRKYQWYENLMKEIQKYRKNINEFFDILMGKEV
jgi:hypothetical protein